jgi:hypothetical protein
VFRVKVAQEISQQRMETVYSEIERDDPVDSI